MMGFLRVLKVLWLLGDRLAPLFERLPDLLPVVGRGMAAGGAASQEAGRLLKGDGAGLVNARQSLDDLADVIALCATRLNTVATQLESAATTISGVTVPTVSASYTRVAGVQVVDGLSFGSTSLFGTVGTQLDGAADTLRTAGSSLNTSVTHLRQLRNALQQAGVDLAVLGAALTDGGNALQAS